MDQKQYTEQYDELYNDPSLKNHLQEDTISTKPPKFYIGSSFNSDKACQKVLDEIIFRNSRNFFSSQLSKKELREKKVSDARMEKRLGNLGLTYRKSRDFMLYCIESYPRAYLYAHPSIIDNDFNVSSIRKSYSTYLLMNEEYRKNDRLVNYPPLK